MTLILELPEELETRLRTAARANGMDEAETARQLLDGALPPAEGALPPAEGALPPAEGALLKKSAFGKYADVGPSVDDFLTEKHAETAREEACWSKDNRAA